MMLSLFDNERAYMALLHTLGVAIVLGVMAVMPFGLAVRHASRWLQGSR